VLVAIVQTCNTEEWNARESKTVPPAQGFSGSDAGISGVRAAHAGSDLLHILLSA
jgi:hypothetical protein